MGFLTVLLEPLVGFAAQLLRLSDLVTGGGVWALPQGVTPHGETLGERLAAIKAVWGKKVKKHRLCKTIVCKNNRKHLLDICDLS